MKALRNIFLGLFLVAALGLCESCATPGEYVAITGYAQGGMYSVKLNTSGVEVSASVLKEGIDSIVLAIDNSVSGYNRGSILSRRNAGEDVPTDAIFDELLAISKDLYVETGGAFDVAAGPLFDIWGFGFTSDSLPSAETVEAVRRACGMQRVLDGSQQRPRLNFNAIAQGYSCDLVARYLYSKGVKDMLVDIGGEIYCDGLNPSGKPWTLGIDRPEDGNNTPGAAVQEYFQSSGGPCGIVTSGNYRKFYVRDGRKYSHTVDPRTGYPVDHSLLCATVIASDATLADALATYFMVIGLEEASAYVEAHPGLEACLIYDEDGAMRSWKSSSWRGL